ncbi:MAG: phage holin family protein [Pseudonocardia sp.]
MTSQTTTQNAASRPAPGTVPADATTGELVQRLSTQLSDLVRGELTLARAELSEKGRQAGVGVGLAGASAVLATYAGGALVAAVVAAIAVALPVWAAALITGGALHAAAGLLGLVARSRINRATPMVPEQAAAGVRRDVAAVKGGLHR